MGFLKITFFTLFLVTSIAAQLPHRFVKGTPSNAAEVTSNDSFLLAKINALQVRCDSIENNWRIQDSLICPKGTIVSSVTTPGADGYLPNTNQTWSLAAGQGLVNGVNVPDLRGRFLRGINYNIGGSHGSLPVNISDSVGREVGSYQVDVFASHSHRQGYMGGCGGGGSAYPTVGGWSGGTFTYMDGPVRTEDIGGSETRPKNVAVYYYVKVK